MWIRVVGVVGDNVDMNFFLYFIANLVIFGLFLPKTAVNN